MNLTSPSEKIPNQLSAHENLENSTEMAQWSEYSCGYQIMSNQSITYETLTEAFHRAERGFNHIQVDCI